MKKIILFFMILFVIITLSSCTDKINDPFELAKIFDEEEYFVEILVDSDCFESFTDEVGINSKAIKCAIIVTPDNDDYSKSGAFIYFDSEKEAKEAEQVLKNFIGSDETFKNEVYKGIIERSGNVVFIGSEDSWKVIKYYSHRPLIEISIAEK